MVSIVLISIVLIGMRANCASPILVVHCIRGLPAASGMMLSAYRVVECLSAEIGAGRPGGHL